MFLLKLIRVVAFVFSVWLIWHLLYGLGRKKMTSHQAAENPSDHTHRKFVESSVIEENDKAHEGEQS